MRCILVADDEMIERKVLVKKLLAKYGDEYRVLEAENGRQAVELYDENDIAAALLDIEMPGINGLEAAQIIRSKDRSLPLIFVTAFDEFNYAKAAISVHALDYILKPISFFAFSQRLKRALSRVSRSCAMEPSAATDQFPSSLPLITGWYSMENR